MGSLYKFGVTQKAVSLSPTLLIAEDEFFIRLAIAEYLRDEGFEVIEAGNADEALTIFRSGKAIDLLFSDVRMPGTMDGCGLARRVREEWPATRVILTSGYSKELLNAEGRHDLIVPKPYRPQTVLATIQSVMARGSPAN